jgi:hypothetical protein
MKIEIHVYHHFVHDIDPALLQALADKLRASNERLSATVAANVAAVHDTSPSTPKEIENAPKPTT